MHRITTELAASRRLLQLLHLCSPSLPVGGYAYSQGLEGAVDLGWVHDASTLQEWLAVQLQCSLAYVDLPLLQRCHQAASGEDWSQLSQWNDWVLACRESEELRQGDIAMGAALTRLLPSLHVPVPELSRHTFLALFGATAAFWHITTDDALAAYAWIWLENQILSATKLIPLGQTRAQELLVALQDEVLAVLSTATNIADDEVGASLQGVALASLHHETQYSRLFRS